MSRNVMILLAIGIISIIASMFLMKHDIKQAYEKPEPEEEEPEEEEPEAVTQETAKDETESAK